MNGKNGNLAKALTILVVSLICWFVVTTTIAYWWAAIARSESPVGTTEFFLREMLTNVPHYIYFVVIGSIFAFVLDKKASVLWALLTAAIAMCIYAVISHHIFFQGISYLEIGILLNLYALPLAFAVGGALTVHAIRDRKKENENTET